MHTCNIDFNHLARFMIDRTALWLPVKNTWVFILFWMEFSLENMFPTFEVSVSVQFQYQFRFYLFNQDISFYIMTHYPQIAELSWTWRFWNNIVMSNLGAAYPWVQLIHRCLFTDVDVNNLINIHHIIHIEVIILLLI